MDSIIGRVIAGLLALLALGGVMYLGAQGIQSSRVNTEIADIGTLVANVRGQFMQSSTGYTGVTSANSAALITAQVIPAEMIKNGGIVDEWSDPITLASANNGAQFTVTLGGTSLSQAGCIALATGFQGYISMAIGGSTYTQQTMPDTVTAAGVCTTGATITLTYN